MKAVYIYAIVAICLLVVGTFLLLPEYNQVKGGLATSSFTDLVPNDITRGFALSEVARNPAELDELLWERKGWLKRSLLTLALTHFIPHYRPPHAPGATSDW